VILAGKQPIKRNRCEIMYTFRRNALVLVLVLGTATAGCKTAGPQWHVVTQAQPNPMNVHSSFHADSVTFEGAQIDGASVDALATLPAAERSEWLYNLGQLQKAFAGSFLEHRGPIAMSNEAVGPTDLVIRTRIQRIATAKMSADEEAKTTVAAHLQIANGSGAVLDEIAIDTTVTALEVDGAEGLRARRAERFRKAGSAIGLIAATYVRERTGSPVP
jgi:hypothetical protein